MLLINRDKKLKTAEPTEQWEERLKELIKAFPTITILKIRLDGSCRLINKDTIEKPLRAKWYYNLSLYEKAVSFFYDYVNGDKEALWSNCEVYLNSLAATLNGHHVRYLRGEIQYSYTIRKI